MNEWCIKVHRQLGSYWAHLHVYQTLMSSDVRAPAPFLEVEEEMTLTTGILDALEGIMCYDGMTKDTA